MPELDILADDYDELTRRERELHEMGWTPVMMRDEATGAPLHQVVPAGEGGARG